MRLGRRGCVWGCWTPSQRAADTARRAAGQAGRTGDLGDGDRIDRRSQMLQRLKSPSDGRIEVLHPCRIGFGSVHMLVLLFQC